MQLPEDRQVCKEKMKKNVSELFVVANLQKNALKKKRPLFNIIIVYFPDQTCTKEPNRLNVMVAGSV